MSNITLYNATTAQQIYDLVATGLSVNVSYLEENDYPNYLLSPLHSACRRENLDVVRAICESGLNDEYLNLKSGDTTPIIVAAHRDNLEIVKYLVSVGANIDGVLTTISIYGYEDILDYILALKLDLNEKYYGSTPLHEACRSRSISFIEKLLINGADPNIKNEITQNTPLRHLMAIYRTSMHNILHISKLLVVYGANYHDILMIIYSVFVARNQDQINDRIETFKFFIDMGCDAMQIDHNGKTALDYMSNEHKKIITDYLEKKSNCNNDIL